MLSPGLAALLTKAQVERDFLPLKLMPSLAEMLAFRRTWEELMDVPLRDKCA
jgi:hypothetical protein